jgi:hypothetical protein
MTDERFEEFLREAAREYHRPPDTPRGEMWEGIRRRVSRSAGRQPQGRAGRAPWIWWSAGIAAALVVGIAVGRFALRGEVGVETAAVAAADTSTPSSTAFRVAATEHLTQVETFLTLFQAEAHAGRADRATIRPAQDLLFTTQLLLDSPAAEDVQYRTLLEDVELVLAQIAQYSRGRAGDELEFIDRGIEQRGVLLKLQAAVSAGPAGAQGAL